MIYQAPETARVRLDRLRGDKVQQELKEKDGTLIHYKVAGDLLEKVITALRAQLLIFPTKAAPMVHGCTTIAETSAVLQEHMYDAMESLANLDVSKLSS